MMLQAKALEPNMVDIVQGMNRRALTHHLLNMDPGFKLDFTSEFLASRTLEQLQHMLMAVWLQAKPQATTTLVS